MFDLTTILIFLLSIYFMINSFRKSSLIIPHTIIFLYFFISMLISNIFIRNGFYIYEQQINGFPNNSIFFLSIFILVFSIVIYKSNFNKNINLQSYVSKITKSSAIIYIILLAIFILSDFILIRIFGFGSNRLNIYDGLSIGPSLLRIRIILFSLSLFYIIRSPSLHHKVIISIALIIWGFIRWDVTGSLFPLMLPWGLLLVIKNKKQKILLKYFIMILGIIIPIGYLKFLQLDTFFLTRVVLGGHVFWGSINEMWNGDIYYQLSNYIKSFFNLSTFSTNEGFGMGYLMKILSGSFADSYIEKGIRYTAGMPAILIINFGIIISTIIYYILIFFYVKWLTTYTWILFHSNVIVFLIAYRINSVLLDFLLQGEIGMIHIKFVGVLVFFIFLRSFLKQKNKKTIRQAEFNFA